MFAGLSIRGGPVTFTCLKWYLVLPAFKENCMGGGGESWYLTPPSTISVILWQ